MNNDQDSIKATIDYAVAILLGVATILGALAAFYATLWGGNQAQFYVKGLMTTSDANTSYLEALEDYNSMGLTDFKDDFLEIQWKDAVNRNDKADADYFQSQMSDELQLIYEASDDSAQIAAVAYDKAIDGKETALIQQMDSAIIMNQEAKKAVALGNTANENGDKFTFVTVLYTIVLFFGGMAAVTDRLKLKLIYVITSIITFIYSTISMFLIPFP